ncbi:hypothetical protein Rruber_00400 [Rhodococcus ruber]|uniref:alpha/beta hydrolase n=1 Tax=Rhodococcus ruber TaxID=1830 RepID=UPI00315C6302
MTTNPHLRNALVVHGDGDLAHADLVVYAVHGRHQRSSFMSETADRIAAPGVIYALPEASAGSWYPQSFLQDRESNEPLVGFALDAVDTHLNWLEEQGVSPERTVLLGFSQGACLLAEYLLQSGHRYAGAALLTGGYLGPVEQSWAADGKDLDGMPVLLTTSARDEWVPLSRVHATTESFVELGAAVQLHVDDDPEHRINDAVVGYVRRFLTTLTPRR